MDEDYTIYSQDRNHAELAYGQIVRSGLFEQTFTYSGKDLGATYQPAETLFQALGSYFQAD